MATLSNVIERMKLEGALIRNKGTHSIKSIKESLEQIEASVDNLRFDLNNLFSKFIGTFETNFENRNEAIERLRNEELLKGSEKEDKENKSLEISSEPIEKAEFSWGSFLGGLYFAFTAWSLEIDKAIIAGKYAIDLIGKSVRTIGNLFTGIVKPIATWLKATFSTGKIGAFFQPIMNVLRTIGRRIVAFFQPTMDVLRTIGRRIGAFFQPIMNVLRTIGRVFEPILKIIRPMFGVVRAGFAWVPPLIKFFKFLGGPFIMPIFALFEGIRGFMKGFEEGGILEGIKGAIKQVLAGMIVEPLDLLKKAVAWISRMLGFENFSQYLESFSFSAIFEEMWNKIAGAFTDKGFLGGLFEIAKQSLRLMYTKPFDVLKDLVSWISRKIGFENFSKWLDSFSFDDIFNKIWNKVEKIFTSIGKWFSSLSFPDIGQIMSDVWTNLKEGMSNTVKGVKNKFLESMQWWMNIGNKIYDAVIKPIIDTVKGWFSDEKEGPSMSLFDMATEWFKKLENFGDYLYDNYIKPAVDWVKKLFSGEPTKESDMPKAEWSFSDFLKKIVQFILPKPDPNGSFWDPANLAAKAIPDSLYKWAGIDPKTGSIIEQKTTEVAQSGGKAGRGDTNIAAPNVRGGDSTTNHNYITHNHYHQSYKPGLNALPTAQ